MGYYYIPLSNYIRHSSIISTVSGWDFTNWKPHNTPYHNIYSFRMGYYYILLSNFTRHSLIISTVLGWDFTKWKLPNTSYHHIYRFRMGYYYIPLSNFTTLPTIISTVSGRDISTFHHQTITDPTCPLAHCVPSSGSSNAGFSAAKAQRF